MVEVELRNAEELPSLNQWFLSDLSNSFFSSAYAGNHGLGRGGMR